METVQSISASVILFDGYLKEFVAFRRQNNVRMREIVHIQAGQCGNQIGAKVSHTHTIATARLYTCSQCLL